VNYTLVRYTVLESHMTRQITVSRLAGAMVVLCAAFGAPSGAEPAAQRAVQDAAAPRVVAVGDIHGDFDAFRALLERAGIVDAAGRWIAGNTTLIQLGDMMDRGPKVRAVLDLLMDLEAQAAAAGGHVEVLLGNHETMNLTGVTVDVTPAIYATFADEQSEQRREAAYEAYVQWCGVRSARLPRPAPRIYTPVSKSEWMAAHPPGFVEYREALTPQGHYGRWLRTRPAIMRVGDTVFQHAGINPDRAPRHLEDINDQVRTQIRRMDDYRNLMIAQKLMLPFFTLAEMQAVAQAELAANASVSRNGASPPGAADWFDQPDSFGLQNVLRIDSWVLFDAEGPLWFRGFATWTQNNGRSQVEKLLRRYDVEHFVVGHSVPSTMRITPRFAAAIFLIDTGMLSSVYRGGIASALEIRDGRFTAIYPEGRVTLFDSRERAATSR
jgi:Calcineurin-like phosphoesterase